MIKFILTGVAMLLQFFQMASAQYKDWKYLGSIYILTDPEGAAIPEIAAEGNFPILIRLTKELFDFKQAKGQGEDIRFATSDGLPMCYQIEQWNAAEGKASIWVRIPNIKGNSRQKIQVFWGNTEAQDESDGKKVFNESNGYLSVWHMNDPVKDEVGTATSKDQGTIPVAGIIGPAKHFEKGHGIFGGDNLETYPSGAGASTTEAWFRTDKLNTTILAWGKEQRHGKVMMNYRSPSHIAIQCYFADVEGKSILPLNQWCQVVHTYSKNDSRVYINGQLDGATTPLLEIPTPVKIQIGGWDRYSFKGDIDEVRISNVVRSPNWIKLQYENQQPVQTLVGSLVQKGDDFSVSQTGMTIKESKSATLSAKAGGAQKIYWILKKESEETILASDQLSFTFNAGRVVGDQSLTLQFKAIYPNEVRVKDIPIVIKEGIPEPVFTLKAPKTWDGRSSIEVVPEFKNLNILKSKGVGELNYRWNISDIATSKEIAPDRLILLRAQNSGIMKVTLTVDNGGEESVGYTTITVKEPLKDEWVERKGEKDEKPENNQFYPRNDKNEGTLYYNGTLEKVADSVFLKIFADNILVNRYIQNLPIECTYRFTAKLKPGLVKYRVEFGSKTGNQETVVDTIGNIICGDAYIIDGQSNAEANDYGKAVNPFTSDWVRSFGSAETNPDLARLRNWGNAVSYDNHGAKFQIGYWAVELAKQLVEDQKIPVCFINGAVGGSRIDVHQRNETDPQDVNSIYGRLLWRVQQAKLTHGIRGIFWHQGENDQGADGPTGAYGWETYRQYFIDMAGAWKQDYPNIQHYYLFQIWPKSCSMGVNGSDNMLREVQRTLPDYFSNMGIMSTLGVKPEGTCHFPPEGYAELAHLIAPVVEKDNYGKVFTTSITPPNLTKVYFTNSTKDEICLVFDQQIKWDNPLTNQFYLDGASGTVASGSGAGKEIRLKLTKPSVAKTITYLDSKSWRQENILYGENGIAALTFCNVPILDQKNDTTGIVFKKIPEKVVVLTFDDACESHASFVGPLLKKLGFGGSFYISEFEKTFSNKTQYMTWEQIKSLDVLGLEVGNHTLLHRGEKSPEEFNLQTAAIEEHCLANHILKPVTFCWPFYQVQEREYPTLIKRGYLFARGGHERAYKPTIDNPFDVPSFSISNDYFEKNKDLFYKAVKQATAGQIVVLTFHGVPDLEHPFAGTEQKQFSEYMKYLKDNQYTVIAMRDLSRYINPELAAKQLIN